MLLLNYIFQLNILLSFLFFVQAYQLENVHFLISAKINGTSPAILLSNLKSNKLYVYFLFDFAYHNTHVKNSKNVAFFKISTTLNIPIGDELTKYLIAYRFSQKEWTHVKNNKVANNIMYKKVPILLYKEERNDIYNYYFKIEKNDNKKLTLILRVPTQGKKEGFLNIYNILEFPKFQKLNIE